MTWLEPRGSAPPAPLRRYPVPDDLRFVATGLRFPEGPIALDDGSLLVVEVRGEALTRVTPDGRLEPVAALPGGPNGAAVGPDGAVYVCNNGGLPWTPLPDGTWSPTDAQSGSTTPVDYANGWVERVDVRTGAVDRLYERSNDRTLSAPNDIAFDAEGRLWFTDTGKTDDTSTVLGSIHRATHDGGSIASVASGLLGPNGIAFAPDGRHVVVADTPTGRVWTWDLGRGALDGEAPRRHGGSVLATLPGALALDSLAVDSEGRVVVALPGDAALAAVEPDGAMWLVSMPGSMPTNVCFGGADRRTAFVTLGGTGAVVAFRWPTPGLPLPFGL